MRAQGRTAFGPASIGLIIAGLSALGLAGALAIEHIGGLRPCPLCLDQRIAYYAAVPLGLLAAWLAGRGAQGAAWTAARVLLGLLALGFVVNAGLGVYHSGIEWGWWPGPDACSGMAPLAQSPAEMLESLNRPSVVRCDSAALRILGLSLAGYSTLLSAFLALLAGWAALRRI